MNKISLETFMKQSQIFVDAGYSISEAEQKTCFCLGITRKPSLPKKLKDFICSEP